MKPYHEGCKETYGKIKLAAGISRKYCLITEFGKESQAKKSGRESLACLLSLKKQNILAKTIKACLQFAKTYIECVIVQ